MRGRKVGDFCSTPSTKKVRTVYSMVEILGSELARHNNVLAAELLDTLLNILVAVVKSAGLDV